MVLWIMAGWTSWCLVLLLEMLGTYRKALFTGEAFADVLKRHARFLQPDVWRESRWWASPQSSSLIEALCLEIHMGYQAGETALQSLQRFSQEERENPLCRAIQRALAQHEKGVTLVKSLRANLPAGNRFLALWLRTLEISHDFGADLRPVLAHLADLIAEEGVFRGELAGKTVEARWTAWILALSPFAFFLYFWFVSPRALEPLWQVSWGKWAVVYGIASWSAGIIVLQWLVKRIQPDKEPLYDLMILLDLMLLGAKSGMNLSQCLEMVANPDGNRFERAMAEIVGEARKGIPLRRAIDRWETAEKSLEARRLARSFKTALILGTPVSQVLERQAALLRRIARTRLEKLINALPLQLTLCTLCFLFPPVFVVVLLPSVLNFVMKA